MPTPTATQRYWAAMAQVRGLEPLSSPVAARVRGCTVNLSGSDAMYMQRCLAAWLAVDAAPTAASAQQVFARDWFAWCQRYLQEALRQRAIASADAAGRAIWALDVWAHVQYALFALNVAWGEIFRLDTNSRSAFVPRVLEQLLAVRAQEQRWVESSLKAMRARYSESSVAAIRRDAARAPLMPIPFGELAVEWCGESRAAYARRANPLWGLLLESVRPWSRDWSQHWISSKGSKDHGEVQLAAADPALSVALMQWRLWSVQDHSTDRGSTSTIATYRSQAWPLNMGTRFSCATLLKYLGAAATESTQAEVVLVNGGAYPNLAHGVSLVAGYAGVIAGLSFDQEVSDYLGRWLRRFQLPVRADGSLMTRSEVLQLGGGGSRDAAPPTTAAQRDAPAQLPVTYDDYRAWLAGYAKQLYETAKKTLSDAGAGCAPSDRACIVAAQQAAKVRSQMQKTPAGALAKPTLDAAFLVMDVIGVTGAVGGGLSPVYGLPNPFARSFLDASHSTAMSGGTAEALLRLPRAIAHLELLLPGLFSSAAGRAPAAVPAPGACRTYFYGPSEAPCEVCAGQWPPCAEHVPGLVRPAARATQAAWQLACHQQWVAWLSQHPEAARCFPLAGDPIYWGLCAQVDRREVTVDAAYAAWMKYAKQKCPGLVDRPSLLTLFVDSAVRAGALGVF